MTDIVVTIPQYVSDRLMMEKFEHPRQSFWTLQTIPRRLAVGDHVWFVRNGVIVHALKVRRISKNPKKAVQEAVGHNPPAPKGCRLWFDYPSLFVSSVGDYPDEILDENGDFRIEVKGFQGFRYRWWKTVEEQGA